MEEVHVMFLLKLFWFHLETSIMTENVYDRLFSNYCDRIWKLLSRLMMRRHTHSSVPPSRSQESVGRIGEDFLQSRTQNTDAHTVKIVGFNTKLIMRIRTWKIYHIIHIQTWRRRTVKKCNPNVTASVGTPMRIGRRYINIYQRWEVDGMSEDWI